MKINIRNGSKKDLPAIYRLVKALALYENEPDAVTATIEDYHRDFDNGLFSIIVATDKEKVVGMMLFYNAYSTWKGKMIYLEDFIVDKNYRKQGIGQHLMDFLVDYAKQENAKLVKWQVLNWNTPAINFYKKNDAIIEDNWWNCKIFS